MTAVCARRGAECGGAAAGLHRMPTPAGPPHGTNLPAPRGCSQKRPPERAIRLPEDSVRTGC